MGAMQAILREMDLPTPQTRLPRQRYIVSPRHWALQARYRQQQQTARHKPQHNRVQQLRSDNKPQQWW